LGSKKKKEKKKKITELEEEKYDVSMQLNRLDAFLKIEELKFLAQNYKMEGKFEEAINTAEQIIRIAIRFNITSEIKEQEKFINSMAEKVQEDFIISKINDVCSVVEDQYEKLLESNKIMSAHALIQGFKKEYDEVSYFDSIPLVQDLIRKDNKIWVDYQVKVQDNNHQPEFRNEKDEIDEIIRALNKYYDELVKDGQINESHELIKTFIKKYNDNLFIMSLDSVQTLILKEEKVWESYSKLNK